MGGGPYYADMGGSRICTIAGVDQSGADGTDVTGWTKTDEFIVAININSGGKDTESAAYKLKWRDVTDSGSFADIASTGEVHYTVSDSSWNDGDAVATGDQVCDSQGNDTRQAGERNKGDNLTDAIDLPDEYQSELWFGLNCSGADDEHEYEFELWDSTNNRNMGTVTATLTIKAGLNHYTLDVLTDSYAFTGTSLVSLLRDAKLDVLTDSYAHTGTSLVSLLRDGKVDVDTDSYALTGTSLVSLLADRTVAPDTDAYAFTGTAATDFVRTRAMVPTAGAYALTGTSAVSLLRAGKVDVDTDAYAFTGTALDKLAKGYSFPVDTDSYAVGGTSLVSLLRDGVISPLTGGFVVAGTAANLLFNHLVTAGGGSYAISGQSTTMFVTEGGSPNTYGQDKLVFIGGSMATYHGSGSPAYLYIDDGLMTKVSNTLYMKI